MEIKLEEIAVKVAAIVQQTGRFIKNEAKSFSKDKIEYKGFNSLVSYVDKEAENMLVNALKQIVPQADFLTEEGTVEDYDPNKGYNQGFCWIIDPLDGTTNFAHGVPIYSVSVGLMHNGQMVVGVVYEVNQNELFTAYKGGGTKLNGTPVSTSGVNTLEHSLLATGFPYEVFDELPQYMQVLDSFMKSTHGLRRIGTAAIDLAYTACGRFEGFFEVRLKPWDVAAGVLLVKEAGGSVTDFKGLDNAIFGGQMLAAGQCHQALFNIINPIWYK